WRFGRALAATSIRSRPVVSIKQICQTQARVGTWLRQTISTAIGRWTFFSSTPAAFWRFGNFKARTPLTSWQALPSLDNGATGVWEKIQTNGTQDGFNFTPQPNSGHLDWHVV